MNVQAYLSQQERDELEALMDVRDPGLSGPMQGSITRVHGFLTSVLSGPMVMPSEWIPVVFIDPDDVGWESQKQAQRAMSLLMRLYNEIASDLSADGHGYSIIVDRLGDGDDTLELADDWCRGYALGMELRKDEWNEALDTPELHAAFMPILAIARTEKPGLHPIKDARTYEAMVDALPASAVQIAQWWRPRLLASVAATTEQQVGTVRRAAPKVSPNAPCPCGNGKKYKRCCSPLRAV